jgi:hypothetical protein
VQIYADAPVWVIPLLIALYIIYAIVLFTRNRGIDLWLKQLRLLLWFILFILVLNPFLAWEAEFTRKARIGVWVDGSISIDRNELRELEQQFNGLDTVDVFFRDIHNGKIIAGIDSAKATAYTNYSRLTTDAFADMDAIWLITDGNINQGPMVFTGLKAGMKAVALGDTSALDDVSIEAVDAPFNSVVGRNDTVSVWLRNSSAKTRESRINLSENGRMMRQFRVTIAPESEKQLVLPVVSNTPGKKRYKVEIMTTDASPDNNFRYFNINVVKARKRILVFSGFPGFDERILGHMAQQLEDIAVEHAKTIPDLATAALPDGIITIGYPLQPLTVAEQQFWQRQKTAKTPVWFISGPKLDFETLKELPFPIATLPQEKAEALPVFITPSGLRNPLFNRNLEKPFVFDQIWQRTPPLPRDFRLFLRGEADVLLQSIKEKPGRGFMVSQINKGQKILLTAGWHIARAHMAQLGSTAENYWPGVYREILNWLVTPVGNSGIFHNIPDTLYQRNTPFRAAFAVIGDNGSPDNSAILNGTIKSIKGETYFRASRSGSQFLHSLPFLEKGDHTLTLVANTPLGAKLTKTVSFFVFNDGPEAKVTRRNNENLNAIFGRNVVAREAFRPEMLILPPVKVSETRQWLAFPQLYFLFGFIVLLLVDLSLRRKYHKL